MATKPSSVPVWNTGGSNNIEPDSSKKIAGWLIGEQPPAPYFNWMQKLYGEWLQYLSDGAFSGAATFASTLGVTGLSTLASLAVTTTASIGGALTAAAATFSGLITANAGMTAGSNQHVTVSGTGQFKHGDKVKTQAGYAGAFDASDWTRDNTGGLESQAAESAQWCPEFDVGKRVKSVTFAALGNGTVDASIVISEVTSAGALNTIGSTSDNNRAASWGDVTVDITDTTISSTNAIMLTVTPNAAGYRVGNVRWTYDHP